ncbi:hypothetical protein QN277_001136 [Acacia crassicarpa]|uniref:Uncharacterized protein n=1 Tax=Acacia crassicarpa TaxID=499986 RepID=A0AAE1N965_9FABA|nr:hypothetical protein QN277_001136 [Acacia crassicarpa]
MVHSKRRNRLKQKKMNDVVFVMTNSKLARKKQARKTIEYNIDDISFEDEWIVENEGTSSNVEGLDEDNFDLNLNTLSEENLAQVGGQDDTSGNIGAFVDDVVIPNFEFDNEVDRREREVAMHHDVVEDHVEHNVFDDNDLNDLLA